VLNATRDLVLPTTITGSYPRPSWFLSHTGTAVEPPEVVANLIRRELKLPEVEVLAADPRFTLAG
jgi:hypothetical protein